MKSWLRCMTEATLHQSAPYLSYRGYGRGSTHGPEFFQRRRFGNWVRIGRLIFNEGVASYNGDFVIHFNHPTWRDDRNDPTAMTDPCEARGVVHRRGAPGDGHDRSCPTPAVRNPRRDRLNWVNGGCRAPRRNVGFTLASRPPAPLNQTSLQCQLPTSGKPRLTTTVEP
jgi:hypothetical protein